MKSMIFSLLTLTFALIHGACGPDPTDADCLNPTTWYLDADGDGWGGSESFLEACQQPQGYVAQAGDCCDSDARAHPAGTYQTEPSQCADHPWDFDCDHERVKERPHTVWCVHKATEEECQQGREGWASVVPSCGEVGSWLPDGCVWNGYFCEPGPGEAQAVQGCR